MSVRLGLVGAGSWGRNYLRTASASGLHVSCVCRATSVPVDGFTEVPVTDDVGQLLRACDAVVVATPPASHESVVMRAIDAGKPVLLEKPAALSHTATDRILSAADAHGVPLLVGHIHLFHPRFSLLRDRVLGREGPTKVLSTAGNRGPFRDYPSLWDWGPHDVSMCLSLFERGPDDVEAVRHDDGDGTVDVLTLGFGSSRAVLRFGNGMDRKIRRFEAARAGETFVYDDSPGSVDMDPPPLRVMLESFMSVIGGGARDWRWDPRLPLETARVLDLAEHVTSTRTDRFRLPP